METKALVPEIIEKSVEQVIQEGSRTPILDMLEGREGAYQKCLQLAMTATTDNDWTDMGDEPYLEQSGTMKIAFRFGASLLFDRAADNRPMIDREEFTDEFGMFYVYTVTGRAVIGGRPVEAVGTASTRDKFLGWEEYKKTPKPVYQCIENVKKKAVTNFGQNAIKNLLGLRGFSWEDLEKFGIYRKGKARVTYQKKPDAALSERHAEKKQGNGKPFWAWDASDGKKFISAKVGEHFSEAFLKGAGMKAGRNPEIWSARHSDALLQVLTTQYELPSEENHEPSGN